ncbi:MAG: hypothetical protein ACOYNY_05415 [Caldilineaceae bacterium]
MILSRKGALVTLAGSSLASRKILQEQDFSLLCTKANHMARHISFDDVLEILTKEIIASGTGVHARYALNRQFGRGNWRKVKGAVLWRRPEDGTIWVIEAHWFEAHGIGRELPKLVRYLEKE